MQIRNVEMTYDAIYFEMDTDYFEVEGAKKRLKEGEEPELDLRAVGADKSRVRILELKWENEISYENSVFKKNYTMDNLFFQRIKKFCKVFSNFCLVETMLIVSHGKAISLFSILSQKWVYHLFYDQDVRELFRNGTTIGITALFSDQTIRVIRQVKVANAGEDQEPWLEEPSL